MSKRVSPNEIKALMMLKGVTNIRIAKEEGVSKTWVSLVLNNHKKSARIRLAIANALGVKVEDLWSESETENKQAA